MERSSDQVIKPVNLEALSKWVGHIPEDVVRDMAEIAPMLSVLNYDPYSNPPEYGQPDAWVKSNTNKVKANEALYEDKAKMWLKREKDDQGGAAGGEGNKKVMDYEDDNQVPNDDAKSGSQGNKDNESR